MDQGRGGVPVRLRIVQVVTVFLFNLRHPRDFKSTTSRRATLYNTRYTPLPAGHAKRFTDQNNREWVQLEAQTTFFLRADINTTVCCDGGFCQHTARTICGEEEVVGTASRLVTVCSRSFRIQNCRAPTRRQGGEVTKNKRRPRTVQHWPHTKRPGLLGQGLTHFESEWLLG